MYLLNVNTNTLHIQRTGTIPKCKYAAPITEVNILRNKPKNKSSFHECKTCFKPQLTHITST